MASFVHPLRSAPTRVSSTHSRSNTPNSLPVISEDSAIFLEHRDAPPIPPRSLRRPSPRRLMFGQSPRHNYERSPPLYSGFDPVGLTGPKGEKLADLRKQVSGNINNNNFGAARGGWRTLAVFAVMTACLIVGLVVGLVVGLRSRRNGNSGGINPNDSLGGGSGTIPRPVSANTTFPAGAYKIDTYLNAISTNCTSNAATWMCYPFTTYAQNPSASSAAFDWVISPRSESENTSYTISSTPNYFSIVFTNVSLSIQNSGQEDEHYFFQITMQKPTKPAEQLGSQNVASTCYFNQTIFQGYLYTKMNATYSDSTTGNSTGGSYALWPHAVRVEQIANAAANSPTCLGPSGESLGNFSVADTSQECQCLYLNTGT